MKKHYFIILMVVSIIMGVNSLLPAQDNTTVPQVIIGNGGKFETNPPYYDYVTVASYNTSTHTYTLFDTIYTQSVQDVLITDHYAYVAAQDTIVKYDLDTHQRVAAVADSGLASLEISGDKLIVSKQFPVTRFFVEALNASDLALYSFVDNISGECGGVIAVGDSVYVAVNGGYLGSEGKLAVISAASWTVTHEIDFGPDAVGIWDLYGYNGYVYSINHTPGGSANIGSITKLNQYNETFTTNVLGVTVGDGVGIQGTLLYVMFNNGIGSYDLNNDAIADTLIIRDPGSANHIYFLAAALDYVNNDFYLNVGNYSVPGKGFVTTITGDSLTSFNEGISANALAIEYLTPAGINPGNIRDEVIAISPNPVNGWLKVTFNGREETRGMTISDITGRTVYSSDLKGNEKSMRVNTSSFPSGVYFLSVNTNNGNIVKKFIKQ
jgi:hypothetical protein